MKPIALVSKMLKNSCASGNLVLDPFAGSGSTLIACEQLGLRAGLVELDPKYCDVIIERWEKLTGQKAELLPAKAD
jgi:DNA modification methylase